MVCSQYKVSTCSELREFINETLCNHNLLKRGVFPLTERRLQRGGKPCGRIYCLHGPRMVKFTAIWEMEKNQVLFYGPTGQKVQQTTLLESVVDDVPSR